MTESVHECDVVVVGLGPGGEHVAAVLAKAGLEVVALDERLVGRVPVLRVCADQDDDRGCDHAA